MNTIRLVQAQGGRNEVLTGVGPDQLVISDEMVTAVDVCRRMFPHVVQTVAGNIAVAKGLDPEQRLHTMKSLRDGLRSAIDERNAGSNAIMCSTTEESTYNEARC